MWYLGMMARFYLWRHKPCVVAIAGNRGKTVFKRTLTGLLQRGFAARANPRSYNTEIGLPLAVLGLEINPRDWRQVAGTMLKATARAGLKRETLELLVLEFGARRAGDMAALLRIARPDWAVVTELAVEEENDPGDLAVMRREAEQLCRTVPRERLLLSEEEKISESFSKEPATPHLTFGRSRLRTVGAGYIFSGENRDYTFGNELVGESALLAAQAAILLGERLGLDEKLLEAFLTETSGPPPP